MATYIGMHKMPMMLLSNKTEMDNPHQELNFPFAH